MSLKAGRRGVAAKWVDRFGNLKIQTEIPQATGTTLGGVKARAKTSKDALEVAIDAATGKLYAAGGINRTVPSNMDIYAEVKHNSSGAFISTTQPNIPSSLFRGGAKAYPVTDDDGYTVPVKFNATDEQFYVPEAQGGSGFTKWKRVTAKIDNAASPSGPASEKTFALTFDSRGYACAKAYFLFDIPADFKMPAKCRFTFEVNLSGTGRGAITKVTMFARNFNTSNNYFEMYAPVTVEQLDPSFSNFGGDYSAYCVDTDPRAFRYGSASINPQFYVMMRLPGMSGSKNVKIQNLYFEYEAE